MASYEMHVKCHVYDPKQRFEKRIVETKVSSFLYAFALILQ